MNNPLCRYKNIFGEPGKGVHSYRIFNIAIVDVVSTFFLSLFIWSFLKNRTLSNYISITLYCFILGIILHHLFCVRTTVDKFIFG
jgi:hypothetical protein